MKNYIRTYPEFQIGQPVTCILFSGTWVIDHITEIDHEYFNTFRYRLRRLNDYQDNIVQIWLEKSRIEKVRPYLVSNNDLPFEQEYAS